MEPNGVRVCSRKWKRKSTLISGKQIVIVVVFTCVICSLVQWMLMAVGRKLLALQCQQWYNNQQWAMMWICLGFKLLRTCHKHIIWLVLSNDTKSVWFSRCVCWHVYTTTVLFYKPCCNKLSAILSWTYKPCMTSENLLKQILKKIKHSLSSLSNTREAKKGFNHWCVCVCVCVFWTKWVQY